MIEAYTGLKTYIPSSIPRAFEYLLENVSTVNSQLGAALKVFPGGEPNLCRLFLGILLNDGIVAWSPNAPSHPTILEAEGKNREDVLAYVQIDHPVNPGPSKIVVTGINRKGMNDLTGFMVAAIPDPASQLCVQLVDRLPDVGERKKVFQGTVGRYEWLNRRSKLAPNLFRF